MVTSWIDFFAGGWLAMLLYGVGCMALFIRHENKRNQMLCQLHYDVAYWQQVARVREKELSKTTENKP